MDLFNLYKEKSIRATEFTMWKTGFMHLLFLHIFSVFDHRIHCFMQWKIITYSFKLDFISYVIRISARPVKEEISETMTKDRTTQLSGLICCFDWDFSGATFTNVLRPFNIALGLFELKLFKGI